MHQMHPPVHHAHYPVHQMHRPGAVESGLNGAIISSVVISLKEAML